MWVCIISVFLRVVILLYSLTLCFSSAILISSSGVANESSRLLITPLTHYYSILHVDTLCIWCWETYPFLACFRHVFCCCLFELPLAGYHSYVFWHFLASTYSIWFFLWGKVITDPILFHLKIRLLWILKSQFHFQNQSWINTFWFFKRRSHNWCIVFISSILHQPPWSPTYVGNEPSGKPIRLGWYGDTIPVYSCQD